MSMTFKNWNIFSQAWELMLIIPALREAKVGGLLELTVEEPPQQHGKTPSL